MVKRRKPGSAKGESKPLKRTLDQGFHKRLDMAMQAQGVDVPMLAKRAKCTRAALHRYLDAKKPPKQIEALLLFAISDALDVSPRWLLLEGGPMARELSPTPDQNRALNIFTLLTNKDAREEWLRQGDGLVRLQPPQLVPSIAQPFTNAKVKSS